MVRLNSKYLEQPLVPRFAPTYACIFMNDIESKFLETQLLKPLIWSRYPDDVFFYLDSWGIKASVIPY